MPDFPQSMQRVVNFNQELKLATNFAQAMKLTTAFTQSVDTNWEALPDPGSIFVDPTIEPMINVLYPPTGYTQYACDATGATDDAANVQALINARLGTLHFPSNPAGGYGRYSIGTKLTIPNRYGYGIVGDGMPRLDQQGTSFEGYGSALCWTGAAGGTLLEHTGSNFFLNNIGLWGRLNTGQADKAAYGLVLKKGADVGTGKVCMPAIHFEDFTTAAIGTSDAGGSLGCDSIWCGFMTSRDNEWVFELDNANGVLHEFGHIQSINTPNGFNIVGGGGEVRVHAMNWLSSTGIFIKDRGMTYATAPMVFERVHFDAAASGSTLFDVGNQAGTSLITFRDCAFGASMTMDGTINRPAGNAAAVVRFDNCKIDGAFLDQFTLIGNTNAKALLHVTNCFTKYQIDDWCKTTCAHADIYGQGNYYKSGTDFGVMWRDIQCNYDFASTKLHRQMWPQSNTEVWENITPA